MSLYDFFNQTNTSHSSIVNSVKVDNSLQQQLYNFKSNQRSQILTIQKNQKKYIPQENYKTSMTNRFCRIDKQAQSQQTKRKRNISLEDEHKHLQANELKGTNTKIFKPFFRITQIQQSQQIRSLEILRVAFQKIKLLASSDIQQCNQQLMSLRQDLHVQNINNEFVIEVLEFSINFSITTKNMTQFSKCLGQIKIICRQTNCPIKPQYIAYQIYYLLLNSLFLEYQNLIQTLTPQYLFNNLIQKAMKLHQLLVIKNFDKIYRDYLKNEEKYKFIFEFYLNKMQCQHHQIIEKSIQCFGSVDIFNKYIYKDYFQDIE